MLKNLSIAVSIYLGINFIQFLVSLYYTPEAIEHIRFSQGAFYINHQQIGYTLRESTGFIFLLFLAVSYEDIKSKVIQIKQYLLQ